MRDLVPSNPTGDEAQSTGWRPNAALDFKEQARKVSALFTRSALFSLVFVPILWVLSAAEPARKTFFFPFIPSDILVSVFGFLLASALAVFAAAGGLRSWHVERNPGQAELVGRCGWFVMLAAWFTALVGVGQAFDFSHVGLSAPPPPANFFRVSGSLGLGTLVALFAAIATARAALSEGQLNDFRQEAANEIRQMLEKLPTGTPSTSSRVVQYLVLFVAPALLAGGATTLWLPLKFAPFWVVIAVVSSGIVFGMMPELCRASMMKQLSSVISTVCLGVALWLLATMTLAFGAWKGLYEIGAFTTANDGFTLFFRVLALTLIATTTPVFIGWVLTQPVQSERVRGIIMDRMSRAQWKRVHILEAAPLSVKERLNRARAVFWLKRLRHRNLRVIIATWRQRPALRRIVRNATIGAMLFACVAVTSEAHRFFI